MQQRYVMPFNKELLASGEYDLVIVGGGISGLYAALNAEESMSVLVIIKDHIRESNSSLAQGGIAAFLNEKDTLEEYVKDTLVAGCYHNNPESVKIMVSESAESLRQMIEYGVKFDCESNGQLSFTKEGGHSCRRILHVKDQTGKAMIEELIQKIKQRNNIQILENTFCLDLITDDNCCRGVLIKQDDLPVSIIKATTVILACGGVGQMYMHTTNSKTATGDGIAMAYRAGAAMLDMEFIQFHPTGLYDPEAEQTFLISEAVRGEGAILRNHHGIAFMKKYHKMADLAPRDVTARAMFAEMKAENQPYVYLDCRHKESEYIKNRFPYIYQHCLQSGIDITKDMIPVTPVQHYIMGGIAVDSYARTTINGLYAFGETACTGVHGANRLASNSLLEGIVFAKRAIQKISEKQRTLKASSKKRIILMSEHSENSDRKITDAGQQIETIRFEIKKNNTDHVFIIRTKKGLLEALEVINALQKRLENRIPQTRREAETINMAAVSKMVILAALKREYSAGSHQMGEDEYDI